MNRSFKMHWKTIAVICATAISFLSVTLDAQTARLNGTVIGRANEAGDLVPIWKVTELIHEDALHDDVKLTHCMKSPGGLAPTGYTHSLTSGPNVYYIGELVGEGDVPLPSSQQEVGPGEASGNTQLSGGIASIDSTDSSSDDGSSAGNGGENTHKGDIPLWDFWIQPSQAQNIYSGKVNTTDGNPGGGSSQPGGSDYQYPAPQLVPNPYQPQRPTHPAATQQPRLSPGRARTDIQPHHQGSGTPPLRGNANGSGNAESDARLHKAFMVGGTMVHETNWAPYFQQMHDALSKASAQFYNKHPNMNGKYKKTFTFDMIYDREKQTYRLVNFHYDMTGTPVLDADAAKLIENSIMTQGHLGFPGGSHTVQPGGSINSTFGADEPHSDERSNPAGYWVPDVQ